MTSRQRKCFRRIKKVPYSCWSKPSLILNLEPASKLSWQLQCQSRCDLSRFQVAKSVCDKDGWLRLLRLWKRELETTNSIILANHKESRRGLSPLKSRVHRAGQVRCLNGQVKCFLQVAMSFFGSEVHCYLLLAFHKSAYWAVCLFSRPVLLLKIIMSARTLSVDFKFAEHKLECCEATKRCHSWEVGVNTKVVCRLLFPLWKRGSPIEWRRSWTCDCVVVCRLHRGKTRKPFSEEGRHCPMRKESDHSEPSIALRSDKRNKSSWLTQTGSWSTEDEDPFLSLSLFLEFGVVLPSKRRLLTHTPPWRCSGRCFFSQCAITHSGRFLVMSCWRKVSDYVNLQLMWKRKEIERRKIADPGVIPSTTFVSRHCACSYGQVSRNHVPAAGQHSRTAFPIASLCTPLCFVSVRACDLCVLGLICSSLSWKLQRGKHLEKAISRFLIFLSFTAVCRSIIWV